MNRSLQPLIIGLILVILVLLRAVPVFDPVANLLQRLQLVSSNSQPTPDEVTDPKVIALETEIQRLRAELDADQASAYESVGADVIGKSLVSFRRAIFINRGSQDGVQLDHVVLSQGYLIGVVSQVELNRATVLLLGDSDVRIPVTISGQAEGIVQSQAGGVVIDSVATEDPISSGSIVETSGLGGLYPPGILLGTVGSELERAVFSSYVLNQPTNRADLRFVQVVQP
jgi:rod shape-determining protein MreC